MSATLPVPARPARWSLSDGTVEALKWIAFLAMVADHIDVLFFDRTMPALFAIGRVAMPVFAIVLGYNLSRCRDPERVVRRLIIAGLLVQPLAIATINRGEILPLNILLTFAAGAALVTLGDRGRLHLAGVLLVVATLAMDYSVIGAGLVAVSWLYFRTGRAGALAGLAVLVAGLCALNGNSWALVGVGLVLAAGWVPVDLPRVRGGFLALYVGHLLALGGLALWLR